MISDTLVFIYEYLFFCASLGGTVLVLWFPLHWLKRFDDYDKAKLNYDYVFNK